MRVLVLFFVMKSAVLAEIFASSQEIVPGVANIKLFGPRSRLWLSLYWKVSRGMLSIYLTIRWASVPLTCCNDLAA